MNAKLKKRFGLFYKNKKKIGFMVYILIFIVLIAAELM